MSVVCGTGGGALFQRFAQDASARVGSGDVGTQRTGGFLGGGW